MEHEYENMRRLQYENGALFVPVCEKCHRFVKADDEIAFSQWDGSLGEQTNATCRKCGRTRMLFEGFY